jgi:hypothetical protein
MFFALELLKILIKNVVKGKGSQVYNYVRKFSPVQTIFF